MPRNILCFIICTFICLVLVGCAPEDDYSSGDSITPSISTTLGETPTVTLEAGETQSICFRVVTEEPVFRSDFSVSISDTRVADVEYLKISGDYVYYSIKAKAPGTFSLYLEIPALDLKSDAVTVKVTEVVPDNIYSSLGEEPVVSITEESSKTVCFRVGENISPESVTPVIDDESIAKVEFERSSGAYFYYKITAVSKGSAKFYLEMTELGLRSETVNVSIIEKGQASDTEEETESYIGNSNSKKFHMPSCTYAQEMNNENKVVFGLDVDRQEIIDQGYTPCGHCKP